MLEPALPCRPCGPCRNSQTSPGPHGPGNGCVSPFGPQSQMQITVSPMFSLVEILAGVARWDEIAVTFVG